MESLHRQAELQRSDFALGHVDLWPNENAGRVTGTEHIRPRGLQFVRGRRLTGLPEVLHEQGHADFQRRELRIGKARPKFDKLFSIGPLDRPDVGRDSARKRCQDDRCLGVASAATARIQLERDLDFFSTNVK